MLAIETSTAPLTNWLSEAILIPVFLLDDYCDAIPVAILARADTRPVVGIARGLRDQKKRFLLARALGDYFAAGQPALLTKGASEHQQRNRAFAAEFLAPAASLRALITNRRLDEEEITELAERFEVSAYVIRHQVKNHELAEVTG